MRRRRIFQRRGADSHPGRRIPSLLPPPFRTKEGTRRRETRVTGYRLGREMQIVKRGILESRFAFPICQIAREIVRLWAEINDRPSSSLASSSSNRDLSPRASDLEDSIRNSFDSCCVMPFDRALLNKNAFCFLFAVDSFLCNILINPFDFSLTRSAWFFFFFFFESLKNI